MRDRTYFTADVHLGLETGNPSERERRFVKWLKSISSDARTLYLLGDIWDFWYEWKDVIPKEGIRVVAALIDLMDEGVEVYFMPGNHDIWAFSFFESLGMHKIIQPYYTEIDGKRFCLAHGDGLYEPRRSYRLMLKVFHSRFCQSLFSALHPHTAIRLARHWSYGSRRTHMPYRWKGKDEPLVKFVETEISQGRHADYYIFGHYHVGVHETLYPADISAFTSAVHPDGIHAGTSASSHPDRISADAASAAQSGSDTAADSPAQPREANQLIAELFVTDSWIGGGTPYLVFDGKTLFGNK